MVAAGEESTKNHPSEGMEKHPGALRLVACALGIFICYFYYGIIQEKITRGKYGPDKEPFICAQSLVFVQCVANALFVKLLMAFSGSMNNDNTPSYMYGMCAFTYLTAMVTSNSALQYIAYPTQVLGKSCKPIPVMILGVLVARKRYPLAKYLFVLLIIAGVSLFLYKDSKAKLHSGTSTTFGVGELLLLVSLMMDGLTGAIQDKIRANYICKSQPMMLQMNLWSTLFLAFGVIFTGEIFTFAQFVQKYPQVVFYLISFSLASAFGQYFIFMTVSEFGPLTCSILTTTRKFFTILASVILFQNPMSNRQWLGAVLVFVGLTLDSIYGKKAKLVNKEKLNVAVQ
ncbi:hypothetical protein M513_03368 [Trichuris suis]|uniref:UAA transporter family protein n=1 Tax=Trichuris suis TaxID=68888 RepID=A0A085MEH4_9BILA|nr:hypothetical protein M513_03368 [Trichuris suis]